MTFNLPTPHTGQLGDILLASYPCPCNSHPIQSNLMGQIWFLRAKIGRALPENT